MNKHRRIFTVLLTISFLLLSACGKKGIDIEGVWKIDTQKTVDRAVETGLLPAEQREKMEGRLAGKSDRYLIKVADGKLTTKEYEATYSVSSQTDTEVIISSEVEGTEFTLTFILLENGGTQIKSSDTNDMDHLVWKKDQNSAVSLKAKSKSPTDSNGETPETTFLKICELIIDGYMEEAKSYYSPQYAQRFINKHGKTFEENRSISSIAGWQKEWLKVKSEGNDYNDNVWRVKMIPDEGKGKGNGPGVVYDFHIIDGTWKVVYWSDYPKS